MDENLAYAPLAERLRPTRLDEFVGQTHLVGQGKPLWALFHGKMRFSMVLYGPPGVGKTSFLNLFLSNTPLPAHTFSAVTASISEVKVVLQKAEAQKAAGMGPTLLVVDEFHRFNRMQQDAFLPSVESGSILLTGLTTENPYFCIQRALLSRVRLFKFHDITVEDLGILLDRALALTGYEVAEELRPMLLGGAAADARRLLGVVDLLIQSVEGRESKVLTREDFQSLELDWKSHFHDRQGDSHYDAISALIKSIRGSDVDASLFWLVRMLNGGEDLMFLMRRLLILASEDIGNADSQALILAASAKTAVEHVGEPEAHLILSHLVCYLALAPKSNATYKALQKAKQHQEKLKTPVRVPLALRGKTTQRNEPGADEAAYLYPHDHPGHYVDQNYWPPGIKPQRYYVPTKEGFEQTIQSWLNNAKKS